MGHDIYASGSFVSAFTSTAKPWRTVHSEKVVLVPQHPARLFLCQSQCQLSPTLLRQYVEIIAHLNGSRENFFLLWYIMVVPRDVHCTAQLLWCSLAENKNAGGGQKGLVTIPLNRVLRHFAPPHTNLSHSPSLSGKSSKGIL